MADALYVPLVKLTIHPEQNANRPAIEKTTREVICPKWEVPLIKARWGRAARKFDEVAFTDSGNQDPYMEVPAVDGPEKAAKLEADRLISIHGSKLFNSTFRGDEWPETFAKYARKDNPWAKKRNEDERKLADQIAEKSVELMAQGAAKAAARSIPRALT